MGALIVIAILAIIVSIAMTTKEDHDEASRKLARWNPLFIAITLACVAIVLWPRG